MEESHTKDIHRAEIVVNWRSTFETYFGFRLHDVSRWDRCVRLLHRETDPSSLAAIRILFGFLMLMDIPQERGLSELDSRWDSSTLCHFPLFDFMGPLTLEWMYMVYLIMTIGATGLMLGLFYRLSCVLFSVTYWYVFLLDTTTWNNHSYLYGLIGLLFCAVDANRCWSLDKVLKRAPGNCSNEGVPLWNYAILRAQIFLVYFIAGIKKMDDDWLQGYSMVQLSNHHVFNLFRLFLTEGQIDYYIIHISGFLLDLTIGFFMFFDASRKVAFFFCASFHLINSQLFKIGMFPFVMIATMPIFSKPSWPRNILQYCYQLRMSWPKLNMIHLIFWRNNSRFINQSATKKPNKMKKFRKCSRAQTSLSPTFKHSVQVIFCVAYLVVQLFLPFSHFITQGTNHWTEGLYGYSWNMMVHSWRPLLTRVVVTDKDSGETHFLDPSLLVARSRWTRHAKLAKQFSICAKSNVESRGLRNIELRLDVWISLNDRFHQRFFDPRVDILTANWSFFRPTPWVLPLLPDLSHWRRHIRNVSNEYRNESYSAISAYIADYPGLTFENCIDNDLEEIKLEVLHGEVSVDIFGQDKVTLNKRGQLKLFPGECHKIHVISATPAYYFYAAVNATLRLARDGINNSNIVQLMSSTKITQTKGKHEIECTFFRKSKYRKFEASIVKTIDAFVILLKRLFKNWI